MNIIFENCNILYFKNKEIFIDLISQYKNIFNNKIIISDFIELNDLCELYGIIHILNTNNSRLPDKKIDCIICDKKDTNEEYIIKHKLNISIFYLDKQQVWCSICHKNYPLKKTPINKYCSEKCMRKHNGFNKDLKDEIMKDIGLSTIINQMIKKDKEPLESNKSNKIQSSIIKDAIKLEYALKRESYKKEMRQPSLRKADLSNKKTSEEKIIKICKGITKKGIKCTNRTIGSSDYCGILSHATN